jgi:LysR family transcriptional regulator, hypochlorite-specific transcription factor HypT
VDTRWLQDFLTLVETRNFTKAAALRNASQAAFSRRIQSLEAWAGTALIDRSEYPPRLTQSGEQFRVHAAEVLARLMDARGELDGRPVFGRDHVRIALPYLISTALFPQWWKTWSAKTTLSCSLLHGNVHDLTTALVSGAADIMICHETAQQPVHLDPAEFERLTLGADVLRPWVSPALSASPHFSFPGFEGRPVPLLMYSPGVYFARLVDLIVESAARPLNGVRLVETDMADALHAIAMEGQGVAWLTQSTVSAHGNRLVPVGGDAWSLPLTITAFRVKKSRQTAVSRLWSHLAASAHPQRT